MKKILGLALAGALTVGFGATSPAHAAPAAPTPPVPAPAPTAPAAEGEIVNVLVLLKQQPKGPGNQAQGLSAVKTVAGRWSGKPGVKIRRSFGLLVRGFSAAVPAELVADLAHDPDVMSVTPLATYYPSMNTAGELTQSVQARTNKNIDGRGLLVSIVDSGIDIKHKDLRLDPDAKASMKLQPQAGWTDKVPYGFNFADRNSTVKDTGSQHGQHVAGIVAANGTEDQIAAHEAIDGIAPNAQLLAMKVFSNDPYLGGGAAEDDIIAAIEKSVELKADIINMSLGSPNGLNEGGVGEGRAIQAAVDAGVQVIVAAGNDGLEFSKNGVTDDGSGLLDNATMANPASTPGAFTIASVNNSHAMGTLASATGAGAPASFGFKLATGQADGKPHTLVDCGLGNDADIPAEAAGNYCLIQRGSIAFSLKFKNAIAKGATGVVVYNNAGEAFVGMGGLDGITQFGASIFQSDGEKLKAAIAQGPVTVTFASKVAPFPNQHAGEPSDFTSFGATPELAFKPQLAGIGGSVWSLANDDSYQDMSGTSMATPHVAGIFALGLQEYLKRYPTMSPQDRGARLKVALSNTAKITAQADGVPFPARQQGAGLAQTDSALDTQVFATVDGVPNVALKQLSGPKTFTITLENTGTVARTYTVEPTCVVNEIQAAGQPLKTVCSGSDKVTTSVTTVTVQPQAKATLDVTVTADTATRHWVEGWVKLISAEAGVPSLSVPYLGFAGDWNAEPIIDAPKGTTGAGKLVSLGAKAGNETMLMAGSAGGTASVMFGSINYVSPNGDGVRDTVYGSYAMLRSARTIKYSVWDATGKTKLADLGEDRQVQRLTLGKLMTGIRTQRSSSHAWDGMLYDAATDTYKPVPDGTYLYRAEPCLGADDRCQVVDQKFQTDTVAPTFTTQQTPSGTSTILTVLYNDDQGTVHSGVSGSTSGISITDAQTGAVIKTPTGLGGKVSATLPATVKAVKITVTDYAGNSTSRFETIGGQSFVGFSAKTAFAGWINKKSADPATKAPLLKADGTVTLKVLGSPTLTKAAASVTRTPLPTEPGKPAAAPSTESLGDVALTNGAGTLTLPYVEGVNEVTLTANDAGGQSYTDTLQVKVDVSGPVVTLTNGAEIRDASGKVTLDADGTVTLKGTIWDNRATPEGVKGSDGTLDPMSMLVAVTISDNQIVPVGLANPDGTFEMQLTPDPEDADVEVYFLDGYDLGTGKILNVGTIHEDLTLARPASSASGTAPMSISHLDDRFDGANPTTEPFGGGVWILDRTFDIEVIDGVPTLHLGGVFSRAPGSFTINGKNVMIKDTVFLTDIPLKEGVTSVPYEVKDTDGTIISSAAYKFLYDKTLPAYELTSTPDVAADGAIWFNAESVKTGKVSLTGTVWDNAFGYTFKVNGNVVKDFEALWDPSDKVNKRAYDATVALTEGNVRLGLHDAVGNGLERTVPVHADTVVPEITVDGVPGNTPIVAGDKITVKATDAHLRQLAVVVDGKPVETRLAKVGIDGGAKVVYSNPNDPTQEWEWTEGGKAVAGETELVYVVEGLGKGTHEIQVTATDIAGNQASTLAVATVNTAPTIGGPDAVTLNPDDGDLLKQIQATFPVTDDEQGLVVTTDTSVLRLGEAVKVTLRVSDSQGNTTEKVVTITLDRPVTTLKGACGSMRGKFAKGETIQITCTKNADGTTTVVVKNSGAPIDGDITLTEGISGPVVVLGPDGQPIGTIPAQPMTFHGSSQATYQFGTPSPVVPPAPRPTDPAPTTPAKPSGVFGDQTGDKLADIMAIDANGDLWVYPVVNAPAPRTTNGVKVGAGWKDMTWMSVVPDLNKDGWSDLLAIKSDGTLWLYYGRGLGQYGYGTKVGAGWNADFDLQTVLKDTDGNGLPELVARRKDGKLFRYAMVTAKGQFANAVQIGHGWDGIVRQLTVDDFSRDGKPDLLAVTDGGDMIRYTFDGTGRVAAQAKVGAGWQGMTWAFSPGDVTGDGVRDMIGRTAKGDLLVYPNQIGAWGVTTPLGSGWGAYPKVF